MNRFGSNLSRKDPPPLLSHSRSQGLDPESRVQNLFGERMECRDTVGEEYERPPRTPCSGATGQADLRSAAKKSFYTSRTKSQAQRSRQTGFQTLTVPWRFVGY